MKTAKTFRLSEQAIKQLQTLKERTGTNETAIIEIALALFEQGIVEGVRVDRTFGGAPSVEAGEAPNVREEQTEQEELLRKFPQLKGMQMSFPHRKKRKRK
jgi:predicted transcriptional regulator